MRNTSALYKDLIRQSGRMFQAEINVTFADRSIVVLTDEDIMQDSLNIITGTTDEGAFTVGNAVIGQIEFDIDNRDGRFDNTSFDGAEFDVRIGLVIEQDYNGNMRTEKLRKGIFNAEEVTVEENYIHILAFDNVAKLDKPFSDSGLSFPITLGVLYRWICTYCGVSYSAGNFPNNGLEITPDIETLRSSSCRDVISYIAQLACRYVYADVYGTVRFGWYSETGYVINEQQKINSTVAVTGVQITDNNDNTYIIGTQGYCLQIDDNPLASNGDALNNSVWTTDLIGRRLTPFSSDVISDPSLETGDIVIVSDLHGNTYHTPITNMTYCLDGKMSISCDAETVNEKGRTSCSESARIAVQTVRKINKKISEYDIRVKQFSSLMANAMGFFQTDVRQNDGSTISYLHDKPDLADSVVIWKRSIDGFAVSRDGGRTYIAGFDSQGNAVYNVLTAVGIVAEWISAGTLSGVSVIAETGSIAGWTMQSGKLISSDGTMILDGTNNTITVNKDGNQFMKINQNGTAFYRPDENGVMHEIGNISVTPGANTNTYGLSFNIKDGDAMTWSVYDASQSVNVNRLRYDVATQTLTVYGNLVVTGSINGS